jgi:uncharacterized DUF497 family protein
MDRRKEPEEEPEKHGVSFETATLVFDDSHASQSSMPFPRTVALAKNEAISAGIGRSQ